MSNLREKSIAELVEILARMLTSGKFPVFIDFLRLHSFKNIEDQTKINFQFPISALIGANGCGKSSVLQALYGCPKDSSIGKYWFSTKLDPINDDLEESRPYIVYGYKADTGEEREVVKTRIKWDKKNGTSQNYDYWEPSRPIKKLGMKILPGGKRHPTIIKEVMVIDFRYQLSAFDRYFYLEEVEPYHVKKRRTRQDVIRLRAESILQAFNKSYINIKKADPVFQLSEEQCQVISKILGKRYKSGKVLRHRFHGFWAHTVVFESDSSINPLRYTEANAGSGEVAVTLMVYRLSQAKPGSLVLLDEPEYSLHPGAQKEVLKYLLQQSVEKKLQIVFTTHAPAMVEGLPTAAIKVFEQDTTSEKFVIWQNRNVEEAFLSIGQRTLAPVVIRVEDALASEILKEVLDILIKKNEIPESFTKLVDVRYYPGGVGCMKQDIVQCLRNEHVNVFTVFDGTERPECIIKTELMKLGEFTSDVLSKKLKDLTKEEIKFPIDGGIAGGREDQRVESIKQYINYWNKRVRFLPFDVPEAEIWNDDLARNELECVLGDSKDIEFNVSHLNSLGYKERFAHLSEILSNRSSADHIIALQAKFLKHWIKGNPSSLLDIEIILKEVRDAYSDFT